MDLGIKGRKAIVCASSQGLGRASAMALACEGVDVVINGRDAAKVDVAAAEIRAAAPEVTVTTVIGSVTDAACREALLKACPAPDILINNAGGPPPGDFRDWTREMWVAAFDANLHCAVELIRLSLDGMMARGFGRIINITSASARVPIPVLGMSNAMRAALGNFCLGLVPQTSSKGVTINNMLPGPFDTDRIRKSRELSKSVGNAVAGRLGDPDEFGAMCAFLCGRQAGYITGQNIMLDGGLNPGNF